MDLAQPVTLQTRGPFFLWTVWSDTLFTVNAKTGILYLNTALTSPAFRTRRTPRKSLTAVGTETTTDPLGNFFISVPEDLQEAIADYLCGEISAKQLGDIDITELEQELIVAQRVWFRYCL